jgi:threonine aldolase
MIDLYSDTVTKPSPGMLAAMAAAEVGDDQRGDDPTARSLQDRVCALLGKDAALIVPSATMANQIAVMAQCRPGSEVLCHEQAHMLNFEGGGLAANAGAQGVALPGPRGVFTAGDITARLRPDDPHFAVPTLVVVENTTNLGAGHVWPDAAFASVVEVCRSSSLRLHIDGARLFNAAVASGHELTHWSRPADTVQLCFSKGLGCPFGAVLAGSVAVIEQARRLRQRLGGALRQTGILAAAMHYALDHNVKLLHDDHRRLCRIGEALGQDADLELWPHETNMLYFRHRRLDAQEFARALRARGVWLSTIGDKLRLCTHLGVDDAAATRAIALILGMCSEVRV